MTTISTASDHDDKESCALPFIHSPCALRCLVPRAAPGTTYCSRRSSFTRRRHGTFQKPFLLGVIFLSFVLGTGWLLQKKIRCRTLGQSLCPPPLSDRRKLAMTHQSSLGREHNYDGNDPKNKQNKNLWLLSRKMGEGRVALSHRGQRGPMLTLL